jgi:hypothetical protein
MQIDYRSFVYLGKVEVDAIRIYMGIELWEHTLVNDKFLHRIKITALHIWSVVSVISCLEVLIWLK